MPKTFNPAANQPLVPFFDMSLGGLTSIFQNPEHPCEMTYHMSAGSVDEITFNLFDETGFQVEPYIWLARLGANGDNSGVPGGTFQFGYKGNANYYSDPLQFHIESYTPVFQKNAFCLIIHATPLLGITLSNNQYSGTVAKVIYDMADLYSAEVVFDPPLGVQHMQDIGATDRNSTLPGEKKIYKQQNESDWGFLKRACEFCMSQDNKSGYRPRLVDVGGGKQQLLISIAPTTGADYDFEIQAEDSVTIEWSPHLNFSQIFDGAETHMNTTMRGTGYPMKLALDQAVTKGYQQLFGYDSYQAVKSTKPEDVGPPSKLVHVCPESYERNVTQGNIRGRFGGSISTMGGKNPSLAQHISQWCLGMPAELTVLGDWNIKPGTVANVTFKYPLNYKNKDIMALHYTSGLYYVNEVVHTITAESGFLSQLSLERAAMPEYPGVQSS